MHQIFVSSDNKGNTTNTSFNSTVVSQNKIDSYCSSVVASCISCITCKFNKLKDTDDYLTSQLNRMEKLYECYSR